MEMEYRRQPSRAGGSSSSWASSWRSSPVGRRSSSSARPSSRPAQSGRRPSRSSSPPGRSPPASRSRPPDLAVREVPIDPTNAQGVFTDPTKVIGLVPGVTILEGQPVYANFLASQAQGGQFSILGPGETVGPDSEAWRAVSLTVPDDRAVGGLVRPGDTVDVFVTTTVSVPEDVAAAGKYYTDKSTKITYQDLVVLAKTPTFYVMKVPAALAEEISHLQASGAAAFSLALRPPTDDRDRRRLAPRRDDEPDHPALRPAGPGAVPSRGGRLGDAEAEPGPSPSPAASSAP